MSISRPLTESSWYHKPNSLTIEPFLKKHLPDLKYSALSNTLVHQNPAILKQYDLVILFGHDEYWSPNIYNGIQDFLDHGGSLLNMSGNTAWWKTNVTNTELIAHKRPSPEEKKNCYGFWHSCSPEERLLGVSFRFAGYPIYRKFKTDEELQLSSAPEEVLEQSIKDLSGIEITLKSHPIFKGVPENIKHKTIRGRRRCSSD